MTTSWAATIKQNEKARAYVGADYILLIQTVGVWRSLLSFLKPFCSLRTFLHEVKIKYGLAQIRWVFVIKQIRPLTSDFEAVRARNQTGGFKIGRSNLSSLTTEV